MSIINKPLGWILRNLASIFNGNFAIAVFIFTIIINLALIPLSIKSQKSSMQQTRVKPKLDELKKRCGDDKQKYSAAMQEVYQEEGVSMSGGCLPMIIRWLLVSSQKKNCAILKLPSPTGILWKNASCSVEDKNIVLYTIKK